MKSRVVVGAVLALAAAAGVAGAWHWHRNADARRVMAEVAARLKDPESAKFEGVFYNPTEKVGCGYVNAKNSFGAYVGARQFYFVDETNHLEMAPPEADGSSSEERMRQLKELLEFQKTYMRVCLNKEPQ